MSQYGKKFTGRVPRRAKLRAWVMLESAERALRKIASSGNPTARQAVRRLEQHRAKLNVGAILVTTY